jgi:Tfp pilus assembly protein PilF
MYEEAARRQPIRWYHLCGLAIALGAAGQTSRAEETLKRALSLAPGETTILYALGETYAGQGRLQDAASVFRKAWSANLDVAEGANNLGTTLLRLGDLTGARTVLREAVRLRPENSATHINLANVLSRTGSLLEAKHQLESAIRIGPGLAEARSAYAATLAENGSLEEARQRYEATLYLQLADAHNNLGTLLAALGNRAQAIEEYRIAVNDAPGSADANFNLGLTLAEQGRAAEAREYLEKRRQARSGTVRSSSQTGRSVVVAASGCARGAALAESGAKSECASAEGGQRIVDAAAMTGLRPVGRLGSLPHYQVNCSVRFMSGSPPMDAVRWSLSSLPNDAGFLKVTESEGGSKL